VATLAQSCIQLNKAQQARILPKDNWNLRPREEPQRLLQEILQQGEIPPPSLSEVARRLGHHRHPLRRRFPDECQQISERYHAYTKANKVRRIEQNCQKVRDGVHALIAQGEVPDRKSVGAFIGSRAVLLNPEVERAYLQALIDLEYQLPPE
jgi:hypothetical protein